MNNNNNSIYQMFGSMQNFQNQLDRFKQNLGGADPQKMVQHLLDSGQMSQQQFNIISQLANQIMRSR